jgi:serine/threonine protein kinase
LLYDAPFIIDGENADIWSLGITIIECAEGQPPFYGVKPLRAMFMISSKPSPSLKDAESYSDNMKDFISKCLQKNPYNRPQSKDLITHPWIATEVAQMSASPEGSNLQVLKDLVTDNWQAILDMRKCIQEVTVTPGSPERSQLNSISDEADTLRLNRKASMVQTNSMADTIKAGAGGRMTGMDDTMDAERGDNVSNLYTSVVRVMIPHPMSPFVADAAGKGGGNSPRNVAPNTRSVSITREHLASRENIHLTPGQMREWQSQSIDGAREGSFIRVNPYPHERHGSIVRRLSAMPNSQYNSNVEAALKYFRNEAVENSLMESRNNYYAGLMTEIEMAQPNFDPDSMSPERRENYHRELQEIDAQYMDELKKLETNYWEKKKQLFLTYELGNDENSG